MINWTFRTVRYSVKQKHIFSSERKGQKRNGMADRNAAETYETLKTGNDNKLKITVIMYISKVDPCLKTLH